MVADLTSSAFSSAFDPFANPFWLLKIDPAITDSALDQAYAAAIEALGPSQAKDAAYAIKDPALRLKAELTFPLDCPPELLEYFYSESSPLSIEDALRNAERFPALVRTNYLVRCWVHLGVSDLLLLALVDAHSSIDPMDIYQTLRELHHKAGHPAPSLVSVRTVLDELLAAHCRILVTHANPAEAFVGALLTVENSIRGQREQSRLEIFSALLEASKGVLGQALVVAQRNLKAAADALVDHPDHDLQINTLARESGNLASVSNLIRQLGPADQLPTQSNVIWENLESLLTSLVDKHQIDSAQKVIGAVADALQPFPTEHAQAVGIAKLLRKESDPIRGGPTGAPDPQHKNAVRKLAHYKPRLIAAVVSLVFAGLFVTVWYFWQTGSSVSVNISQSKDDRPRGEPESLPPTSKGQRYPRNYVRYCHFQQERLRIVKMHLRSPEDIRAYNALAADWNSRCADYFYQDEDVRVVRGEVAANQKQLEADAQRILSTWPWHEPTPGSDKSLR